MGRGVFQSMARKRGGKRSAGVGAEGLFLKTGDMWTCISVDSGELIQHCSRSESKIGKAAEVGNMINKRRSLRGKGGENGKCHPEQSGVISHGQEEERRPCLPTHGKESHCYGIRTGPG